LDPGRQGVIRISAAIVVSDLHRRFGGVAAVAGASFSVEEGVTTGLIGPNGAGKSTVLGCIAGAIRPTSGSIRYGETEIAGLAAHQVARLGITRTFQISSEFPRLTVMENLLVGVRSCRGERFWEAVCGPVLWRREEQRHVDRGRQLLADFDMSHMESSLAGELSGGQKRLLELMRALMMEPRVLLLDEPFAGVNPRLAGEIQEHLLELRRNGLTMLMIEHELGIVERMCDQVVVMAQGRVIAEGTMGDVARRSEVLDAYLVG
jgi:ABC-type branched-subunit amino acid transport system ATPase component